MGFVKLQLAMSLDGFIARKDGSVDFLDVMEESLTNDFNDFVETIDTIIMGSATYDVMLSFGEIPFPNKKIIVMTTQNRTTEDKNTIFTEEDLNNLIRRENGTIWLFGGAKLIQSFINLDLIDEYHIVIVPKIIGSGIPLFRENDVPQILTLKNSKQYGDTVMLIYEKKKP